jgi:peroxiredoxin
MTSLRLATELEAYIGGASLRSCFAGAQTRIWCTLRFVKSVRVLTITAVLLSAALLCPSLPAAGSEPIYTPQEQPIVDRLKNIRSVPDDQRGQASIVIADKIRELPATPNKVLLANWLANRVTEGDFGHACLQESATTLADALREQPQPNKDGEPAGAYLTLATLARYEHVQVSMDAPAYAAAMAKLESDDQKRQKADFTLTDLQGKAWNLKALKGQVVLVNFWATWCPPCRKEMPDLEALYNEFHDKGFVVLAISDEELAKVKPFIAEKAITYPVLLDPGDKINREFAVEGIPKSFVYDRDGKLVAQSIDMRTRGQFLQMLGRAGLQ